MKNGLMHFGLVCCVVGLLAAQAAASSPTFTPKLVGIQRVGEDPVLFRDIDCDPNADACETLAGPGSHCVSTEVLFSGFFRDRCSPLGHEVALLCEGGPTPGEPCTTNFDCGDRGICRRTAVVPMLCSGGPTPYEPCTTDADCGAGGTCIGGTIAPLLCGDGVTPCTDDADCGAGGLCNRSFVEPGDQIILDVFVRGWDDDPDVGSCNVVPDPRPCDIGGAPCAGRHCSSDHFPCSDARDCSGGGVQQCVPNECVVSPVLGGCQWTIDSSSYASLDDPNPRAALLPARVSCALDEDCHHGRIAGGGQCTCGNAVCDLDRGYCSSDATGYVDMIRADFLFKDLAGPQYQVIVGTGDPDYRYVMAALADVEDAQKEEYVGTVWLLVPNQAAGTYQLAFKEGPGHTGVVTPNAQLFPPATLETLVIEVFNPCAGFDVPTECGPDPDACRQQTCVSLFGEATCVLASRDCVQELGPGYVCVAAEGGCVPGRACCDPSGVRNCRRKSELECDALSWEWKPRFNECGENDAACVEPPFCPAGRMRWASPPSGVLDARQPNAVDDQTALQGIDVIVVDGPNGAEATCFTLCETVAEAVPNDVAGVVEDPPGTYTITLERRITPGGVTVITYDEQGVNTSFGEFSSLPGDVDTGGGGTTIEDLVELVECCLNQNCQPVHDEYSCDIDRSGGVNGADVLREIDLLHGAGAFIRAWDGAPLETEGCP